MPMDDMWQLAPEASVALIASATSPKGCAACNYTGYRGRLGIFEMMQIDDDIRALVTQNIDSKTIKNKAVSKGMHTLRYDGARKVLAGLTSVAEILRATEEEAAVAQI